MKKSKNIVVGLTIFIVVFLISGCGGEVVKVVFIPVAGGLGFGAMVFWLCVAVGIDSCGKQQQLRHTNQILAERSASPKWATDLPPGISPSDKNYQRYFDLCTSCVPMLKITKEHNLKAKYRMFVKSLSVKKIDTESWREVSVSVRNTYGHNEMTFHTNDLIDENGFDLIFIYKVVVTWEQPEEEPIVQKEPVVEDPLEVQKKPNIKRHYVDDYRDNSMYQ